MNPLEKEARAALAAGRTDQAESLSREALLSDPYALEARLVLALCAGRRGDREACADYCRQCLCLDPSCQEAWQIMATVSIRMGNLPKAEQCFHELIRLDPRNAGYHNNLGNCRLASGDFAQAASNFRHAAELDPANAQAQHNLGLCLQRLGRIAEAESHFRLAVERNPGSFESCQALARVLTLQGAPEAGDRFLDAHRAEPDSARGKICLAYGLFLRERQLSRPLEILNEALQLEPDASGGHALKAMILHQQGDFEGGNAELLEAIRLDPDEPGPYCELVRHQRITEADRPLVEQMRRMSARTDLAAEHRRSLLFALGKSYDDLAEYRLAMEAYHEANGLTKSLGRRPFDRTIYVAENEAILRSSRLALASSDSNRPVFIVGMYRSGTTLVEQLLSNHPNVAAGGELRYWFDRGAQLRQDASKAPKLASEYLAVLSKVDAKALRVTDKQPENYRHLGLLHRVFPNARFVFCRRNAVDSALSLYMTYFAAPPAYASDLDDIVFVYREHLRLMDEWRAIVPADRLLEVRYEEVVTRPEASARAILEFCDLEWDEACLHPERNEREVRTASQWQVRQPLYRTSLDRWRNYEPWLGQLAELKELG